MKITIRPLTPSRWPDLEALFGRNGACNGCWCMYWRIGPEYHKRPREKNRIAFRKIVKHGPPPGLVAFDGKRAVGWCQLTPRQDLRWLNRKPALEAVDDTPVWSISCFYVRRSYRRKGVMSALIVEALKAGKRANAPALEACPVDAGQPGSTPNVFTGTASAFRASASGPSLAAKPSRPIMRHDLRGITL